MHIEERKVTVREVAENYFNDAEEGGVNGIATWLNTHSYKKKPRGTASIRSSPL